MTWFKADDRFWRHRKVRKLGRDKLAAAGLWVLSGTWSADNNNTGFIPDEVVDNWDPRRKIASLLCNVGLWHESEEDGERGYQFHDWHDYQPTPDSIEAEREKWREKKEAQRKGKKRAPATPSQDPVSPGDNTGTRQGTPPGTPRSSPPNVPDPVPVPVPSSGSSRGVGHLGNAREFDQRPPEKCSRHTNDPNPPACGGCGDARRAAQTWDRERSLAIRACTWCDGDGWRWHPDGKRHGVLSERCDHLPPDRQATG